jgi:hypothetical protein
MANPTSAPDVQNFDITYGSLDPSATHYMLFDKDEDLDPAVDVYVLDLNNTCHPNVAGVVLVPCYSGWPIYLYAPTCSLEGMPHEDVVRLAVAAYALQHQDLIGMFRRLQDEGVAGSTIFDGR